MSAPLAILVVGFGLIGREHLARIRAHPGARAAGVVDPDPAARAAAEATGFPVFADLDGALARTRPDAAIVATPTPRHVEPAVRLLEAGVPVLVEKPLSADVAGARTLVAAVRRSGVPVLVGHHRRHQPFVQAARRLVREEGALGRVLLAEALFWVRKPDGYYAPDWRRRPGAGPVLTNLSHDLDLLRHLVGEIEEVRAATANLARGFEVEDTAAVLLHFEGGALGTVSASDAVPAPWSWELASGENPVYPKTDAACYRIGGTEGALELPPLRLWRHAGDGWTTPIAALHHHAPLTDALARQLDHFLAVARGEAEPLVPVHDGARTVAVLEAVLRAAGTGSPQTPPDVGA
ncbi:Putative UDP-kanosamine synthase oxidoreductase subunit [bacterium HR39]|nr:Putative UDP-kanosamine synthase oxidoreductase subunit [bacterium HR39]